LLNFDTLLQTLYAALDAPAPWSATCDALVVGGVARCVSVARSGVMLGKCTTAQGDQPDTSATAAVLCIACQNGVEWVFQWARPQQAPGSLAALKQQLMPHLCRIATLIDRLNMAAQRVSDLVHAVNAVETGILFINAAGQVLLTNNKARTLLLENQPEQPDSPVKALSAAMRQALTDNLAQHRHIKNGNGTTFFSVAPLPKTVSGTDAMPDTLLVVTENTAMGRIATQAQLAGLFGLSHAESAVTQLLALGNTLEEIAVLRDVQLSTVRSQLSGILAKVGMRNQSALIRLVSLVPAVR
jgi:DNA-binding CsgD family transcriptional regulator